VATPPTDGPATEEACKDRPDGCTPGLVGAPDLNDDLLKEILAVGVLERIRVDLPSSIGTQANAFSLLCNC